MTSGTIFDIQRFCTKDGPGIRTTVFFKGCPLRCAWCHNAEGLSRRVSLYYDQTKCIACGACQRACPEGAHEVNEKHRLDFSQCKSCFACTKVCPSGALTVSGKEMTSREVAETVLRDLPFFRSSGGGVTFSGGEGLMQEEFATEIASFLKEKGVHLALETSGYTNGTFPKKLFETVDLVLFDFKHSDPAMHKICTGVALKPILETLEAVSKLGRPIDLRCPLIPSVNDNVAHYRAIARLANETKGVKRICLEPYHPFGLKKYAALGLKASYENEAAMPREAAETALEKIAALTKKPVVLS